MNAKPIQRAAALLASAAAVVALAQDPVASFTAADGADAGPLNAIAQALNAEGSLANSKITVQPDGGHVLLTGVTPTLEQSKRATEIAKAAAGSTMVVNAIQPEHTTYQMPEYDLAKTAEAEKS